MKNLPERLESAITKLYTAFHNGELDAFKCEHCAAGNLCNNNNGWYALRTVKGVGKFSTKKEHLLAGYDEFDYDYAELTAKKSGYSPREIIMVEKVFMENFPNIDSGTDRQRQFKGLCAVVEYLCSLDNVENVMSIQSLFEYDQENKPKHELNF